MVVKNMPHKTFLILAALFILVRNVSAAEYEDGRIKLLIDDNNGRFSIYYMTNVDKKIYEPLFWDRDKKTSFLGLYLNGSEYRLGESGRFRMYHRGTATKPSLVFEAPLLQVIVEFSFIRTASSGVSNGIRIDIKLENWGEKTVEAGARLLVDSYLGEANHPNFRTDLRPIESELVIDQSSRDQWWLSRNNKYGLMGSVFVEGIDPPSYIHFANWKRLYSTSFKPEYVPTRNFNEMPFSIRDSAVCYYLDAAPLEKWQSRTFTVLLAADDKFGFDIKKVRPLIVERIIEEKPVRDDDRRESAPPGGGGMQQQQQQMGGGGSAVRRGTILLPIGPIRVDLMTLRELIYKVDEYIYFGTAISEEELRGMEMTITRLKSRYGGILYPYRQLYER
ncbi:MAG: hypothetical protein LBD22_00665 [Spirochaetaceae bacterium]|jgi:hypothetical protein|nr:hypothetical protein [Spirochaetaceae bacterium]